MKPFLVIAALLFSSLQVHAGSCEFDGRRDGQAVSLRCGMSKAALLASLGEPLFFNRPLVADYRQKQGQDAAAENWVYRLEDGRGTLKMVSLRLVQDQLREIMVSR